MTWQNVEGQWLENIPKEENKMSTDNAEFNWDDWDDGRDYSSMINLLPHLKESELISFHKELNRELNHRYKIEDLAIAYRDLQEVCAKICNRDFDNINETIKADLVKNREMLLKLLGD